jgi:N-acetylated-alpha-linked acidic dipeptidase
VIRNIKDPEKDIPVWQRARLYRIAHAENQEKRNEIRNRAELTIGALGDGSDYASFLDHAGVSAVNIGFGGENDADAYHSIYDDFYWYTHFVDTDFSYGRALAQTGGTIVMRLADAELIPFEYKELAETIGKYVADLEKLLKDKQDEISERNLELQEGVFSAIADPHKTSVPPPHDTVAPYMNFAPLKNGVESLKRAAERYQSAFAKTQAEVAPSAQMLNSVNADLLRIQRSFLTERGLPERPWFKNQVYAPGAYTGYGAKPLAAVREYMDAKKWTEADAQIPGVAKVVEDGAAAINKAAEDLEAVTPSGR